MAIQKKQAKAAAMSDEVQRALKQFDAMKFCSKHRGRKESSNPRSHEYLFTCPFCGGGNLRWNPTKQDFIGGWVCWNCGRRGNTVFLVQIFERCTPVGAYDYIMDGYVGGDAKMELTAIAAVPEIPKRSKREKLPPIAWPPSVVDARYHQNVRTYLHGRGIDDQMIVEWCLHAGQSGREKNFVIFPCYMDGVMVYWQARAAWNPPTGLSDEARKAWIKRTHYRKTLNPTNPLPGIRQATASEILFNYDRAATSSHVVVVEGPVDALKVGSNAVALLGKGTEEKIDRLRTMRARRYTIYLDRGTEEAAKAREIAKALHGWAEVFLATPPPGTDAGDLTREQNASVISQAIPASSGELQSNLKL